MPINDLAEHASERSGTSPREHHDINLTPLRNKINRPINDLTEHASERSGTSPREHHDINLSSKKQN